jgi:hypothetical protein
MAVGAGQHKKRMRRPEQAFQKSLVKDLAMILEPRVFFFHVPNGGWRSKVEAAILQAMGVVAGMTDLVIFHEGRAFVMECKPPKGGRLSDDQITCHARITRAGVPVATVRTLREALAFLKLHNIPMRIIEGALA